LEMKQNPANFAACLSMICRIRSRFVKYRQIRLNQQSSEMCTD
jgi:hypothetical protein